MSQMRTFKDSLGNFMGCPECGNADLNLFSVQVTEYANERRYCTAELVAVDNDGLIEEHGYTEIEDCETMEVYETEVGEITCASCFSTLEKLSELDADWGEGFGYSYDEWEEFNQNLEEGIRKGSTKDLLQRFYQDTDTALNITSGFTHHHYEDFKLQGHANKDQVERLAFVGRTLARSGYVNCGDPMPEGEMSIRRWNISEVKIDCDGQYDEDMEPLELRSYTLFLDGMSRKLLTIWVPWRNQADMTDELYAGYKHTVFLVEHLPNDEGVDGAPSAWNNQDNGENRSDQQHFNVTVCELENLVNTLKIVYDIHPVLSEIDLAEREEAA